MTVQVIPAAEAMARLDAFDAIIDARSESEFAEDRLPGAVNWPSLTDQERQQVGTQYKQESAFDAKKRGATLVARNIAAHVEREVMDKPRNWQPLVYCWRGGKRSGSLALVLDQIGFKVCVIDGGYREFRRALVAQLEALPSRFTWRVICGKTGSGKSRLLQVLAQQGAQVLDLEQLAHHRGSVLGILPDLPQPSQKQFDTRIWNVLRRLDPTRPVFVESESKKVGNLRVPDALIQRMRDSECLRLELPDDERVQLLMEDYDFFVKDVESFCKQLDCLTALRGREVVNRWKEAARGGRIEQVVRELLTDHYDPVYLQSMRRNFKHFEQALVVELPARSPAALAAVARGLAA